MAWTRSVRSSWNEDNTARHNAWLLLSTDILLGSLRAAAPAFSNDHRSPLKNMLSRSATLPPTPTPTQVDGERQELTLEATNGDPSALAGRAPDAGTDSVGQGQGDVAENMRATPAKDAAALLR